MNQNLQYVEGKTYSKAAEALDKAAREFYSQNRQMPIAHPIFVKRDGSLVFRPLTFRENLQKKIDDFETLKNPDGSEKSMDERFRLFRVCLSSCTGIAYKANSAKFKIIPLCEQLVTIPKYFRKSSIFINYSGIKGIKLDSKNGKYCQRLARKEVLKHSGWNIAVEEDRGLLEVYSKIVFDALNEKAMGFYLSNRTSLDKLWPLVIDLGDILSCANGANHLNIGTTLRVVHPKNA